MANPNIPPHILQPIMSRPLPVPKSAATGDPKFDALLNRIEQLEKRIFVLHNLVLESNSRLESKLKDSTDLLLQRILENG
jgi:hypothetical protein